MTEIAKRRTENAGKILIQLEISSNPGRFRSGQIFFGRSRRKRDCRLDVFRLEAWKIRKNVLSRIPLRQAGKHGAKRHTGAGEDGFAPTNGRISNNSFTMVH